MLSSSPEIASSCPPLFIFGVPGPVGGAATKIAHVIRLLHRDFAITVVLPSAGFLKEKDFRKQVEPFGIRGLLLKDLPKKLEGVGLAVCERDFFASGTAREAKARGL